MEILILALQKLGVENKYLLQLLKTEGKTKTENRLKELREQGYLTAGDAELAKAVEDAKRVAENCERQEIAILLYGQKGYPENLKCLGDAAPAALFAKGAPLDGCEKAIAITGTRKPTAFGWRGVNYLVPQWVNQGFVIVSGLAEGIDRISHRACLLAGGKTIAVLSLRGLRALP